MSKRELIDAILQLNRTAPPEFLAKFAETDLKAYLDRICAVLDQHTQPLRQMVGLAPSANAA